MVQLSLMLVKRIRLLISNIFSLIQMSINLPSLSVLSKMSHLSNIFINTQVSPLFSIHQDYDSYLQKIFSFIYHCMNCINSAKISLKYIQQKIVAVFFFLITIMTK